MQAAKVAGVGRSEGRLWVVDSTDLRNTLTWTAEVIAMKTKSRRSGFSAARPVPQTEKGHFK
jgi:hypothetical protein